MRIFVDADGCPVVELCIRLGRAYGLPVFLVCDDSHEFCRPGAQTITVDKGADSADLALANRLQPGDLAVTQDYGLAALCLARRARVLDQNGKEYTADNIDALLLTRHTAKKLRRAGGHLRGPARRTPEQNAAFERAMTALLEGAHADD